MSTPIRVAAIIPARMASTRFPGKPLLEVRGLPMVEHVRRRTLLCEGFSEVVVATCDPEIAEVVRAYGGTCLMTSPGHPGATDRVAEAAEQVDCTHVVNVQGDEILVMASDLERMVQAIHADPAVPAWNAAASIEAGSELADPSIVKCAVAQSGRILFCSRQFSHLAATLKTGKAPIRKVLGILGFRRDFLRRYVTLPRTPLEVAEGIDQSRILEHDLVLQAVAFDHGYPGINEPQEVEIISRRLHEDPLQQAALHDILGAAEPRR